MTSSSASSDPSFSFSRSSALHRVFQQLLQGVEERFLSTSSSSTSDDVVRVLEFSIQFYPEDSFQNNDRNDRNDRNDVIYQGPHMILSPCNTSLSSPNPVECSVCMESLEMYSKMVVLPCQHPFHLRCVQQMISYGLSHCPCCRRSIPSAWIHTR